jgi:hypothetical protein
MTIVRRPRWRSQRVWLWTPPALGARSAQWALAALAFAAFSLTPPAAAEGRRVRNLAADIATTGIERVEVRLPIASVRIEPSPDDRVHVDIEVRCCNDSEHCRERAERLSLESNRDATTLRVRVDGMESLRSLSLKLRGRILVPNGKAIDVNLPLGELEIRNVTGDLDVDVGCGEVGIVLRELDVRPVRMGVGVGEATFSVAGRHIEGEGWLGQKVRWNEGAGASRVAVSLGVGELGVKLN